jgi:hypothetical protein
MPWFIEPHSSTIRISLLQAEHTPTHLCWVVAEANLQFSFSPTTATRFCKHREQRQTTPTYCQRVAEAWCRADFDFDLRPARCGSRLPAPQHPQVIQGPTVTLTTEQHYLGAELRPHSSNSTCNTCVPCSRDMNRAVQHMDANTCNFLSLQTVGRCFIHSMSPLEYVDVHPVKPSYKLGAQISHACRCKAAITNEQSRSSWHQAVDFQCARYNRSLTLTMPCILRGGGSGPSGFNCCQQHLQQHNTTAASGR